MRPRTLYHLAGSDGLFQVSIAHPEHPFWARSSSAMEVLLQGGLGLTEISEAEADYVLDCWREVAQAKAGAEPAVTLSGKEIALPDAGPAVVRRAPPPPPPLGVDPGQGVARPTALSELHLICEENPESAQPELLWVRPARSSAKQAPVVVAEETEVRTLSHDEAPLKRSLRS